MTLTLELDPHQQAHLERLARQAGNTPEDYIRSVIGIAHPKPPPSPEAIARLLEHCGKYPRMRSVDEYITEKREEVEREEAKFAERQAGLF